MSRPIGSKNKIQSTFGKNYAHVIKPVETDIDEQQANDEHNATLNEQDATLDAFLIETVDNTIASVEKDYMPIKIKSVRKQLLSLMSQIHSEIAPQINEMRKGLTLAFCREEDKYIPETNREDYVKLIGIA